jgi:hypothetical protein
MRDKVVDSQGLQLARRINSVQINVIEISLRTAILVDQSERRAGDILGRRRLKGFCNAFDQRGLARPQVAAQQHQLGRSKHPGQSAAECNGLFGGVSDEFLGGHSGRIE